jgi:hypothetical protein
VAAEPFAAGLAEAEAEHGAPAAATPTRAKRRLAQQMQYSQQMRYSQQF